MRDNPPYITVMQGVECHVVALMEYSHKDDSYHVARTETKKTRAEAVIRACEWADSAKLEVR